MKLESLKNIAVIGAGTMGQGIAEVCAVSGFSVLLYDAQADLAEKAIAEIQKNLDASVIKKRLTEVQKIQALERIQAVGDFRQLQVDLAIEAVVEKLEVKQKILSELEKINATDCLLVSNTSSLRITQIGAALRHSGRFAGLHFFNPAPAMKLVEIVRGAGTSEHTMQTLASFANHISKSSVRVEDSPGFIVNRVARLFYTESLKIVEDGVADFQTIDKLLLSCGFRMGPFQLMDLIGIDTNFEVTTSMYNAFHQEPKFRPSRIQQLLVDAGHHGRKSGKGFYEYPKS